MTDEELVYLAEILDLLIPEKYQFGIFIIAPDKTISGFGMGCSKCMKEATKQFFNSGATFGVNDEKCQKNH